MSVPLDKLYDFLDSIVKQDLIIYRWMPHGSRKLQDLQPLKDYPDDFVLHTTPMAIFHDQEPLNFELYDLENLIQTYLHYQPTSQLRLNFDTNDLELMTLLRDMHVRGVGTTAFANLYDQTILVHSEKRSEQVTLWQQHNYLPVYYWSHAVIARDWFRYAQYDPELRQRSPTQDFLIYNRSWSGTREYRLKFTEMLLERNLNQRCMISFSRWCDNIDYTDHEFVNPNFAIHNQNLHQHYDQCFATSNSSADYWAPDYVSTRFEIVLETLFDDDRLHLTEKILRPIACGHPFVLMSTPGSLEYLRSYGFKTFGDYWDESYDQITDSKQRMLAVIDLMQHLASLPNKDQLCQEIQAVCEHNRARFFSAEFLNLVVDEYNTNMTHALEQMQQHRYGVFFRRMLRYLHSRSLPIWDHFMPRELVVKLWRHLRS